MTRNNVQPGRVFVVGAYLPNGGAYMAYRLGQILELDFGWKGVAVTAPDQGPTTSIHRYDVAFPEIALEAMEQAITSRDILIANPSFSARQFGLRLPARKLMYVQGFSTYGVLDCYFDHYVAVSGFVANFVANLYGVKAPVIPAFIQLEEFPQPTEWLLRPPASILVSAKGNDAILGRVRELMAREAPDVQLDDVLSTLPDSIPHSELIARLGSYRYLVSLSPAEGFGLIPLEAMAMGTVVLGFDGFGGREYMKSGQNCLVTSYPDLEGLTHQVIAAVRDQALGERLSKEGRITSQAYTYSRFRAAWHEEFRRFLQPSRPDA
jgi:hypothetical protein